jgi:hypothetical protein
MADPALSEKISKIADIWVVDAARTVPAQGTGRCSSASMNCYEHAIRVDDGLLNREAGWKQGQQRTGHGEGGCL